jgi:hypothetical protein
VARPDHLVIPDGVCAWRGTVAYFVVTAGIALVVYEKVGLALLRRAWLNLDLVWALVLVATGVLTLLT